MNVTQSSYMHTFVLAGWRKRDGSIQSDNDSGVFMEEWPETIEIDNRAYSLEEVRSGPAGFEEAFYA